MIYDFEVVGDIIKSKSHGRAKWTYDELSKFSYTHKCECGGSKTYCKIFNMRIYCVRANSLQEAKDYISNDIFSIENKNSRTKGNGICDIATLTCHLENYCTDISGFWKKSNHLRELFRKEANK